MVFRELKSKQIGGPFVDLSITEFVLITAPIAGDKFFAEQASVMNGHTELTDGIAMGF
ncbi:hypothetical protein BH10CYA1_BH10CYA1_65010 [soil metagenome]